MFLILRPGTKVDRDAPEIQGAIRVGQWRLVQIDRLESVGQPFDFAFSDEIQNACICGTVQVVRLFDRRMGTAPAFFVTDNIHF